jgi:hypothetical protein
MYDLPGSNFTRREAVVLSDLTIKQVRTLSKNLIIPHHQDPIRYTYDQVIAFRTIYYLRKKYSYYRIEKVLFENKTDKYYLDIHKMHFVLFSENVCFVIREDDLSFKLLKKYLLLRETYIPSIRYKGILPTNEIEEQYYVDTEFSMICIPYIVKEMWEIAANNNIGNFRNKMRVKFDDYQLSKVS